MGGRDLKVASAYVQRDEISLMFGPDEAVVGRRLRKQEHGVVRNWRFAKSILRKFVSVSSPESQLDDRRPARMAKPSHRPGY